MKGIFKSYLLRLKLATLPFLNGIVRLLDIVNGILSVGVISLLIYELGFQMEVDQKLLHPLYLITFITFFVDYTIYVLIHLIDKQRPKGWRWQLTLYLILLFIVFIWVLPEKYDDDYGIFVALRHFYLLAFLVIIEAILKISSLVTRALRKSLNPSVIFVGSFLFLVLSGAGLLLMPASHNGDVSFVTALFTSTSSVCVTGLSMVDITTVFTKFGQIVILILIQLGGIGIMTFTSFFGLMFVSNHSSQNKLMIKDIVDPDQGINQIFSTLRNILILTLVIEAFGALFLYFSLDMKGADGIWQAVFHSISAFCNAGFSTLSNGLCNIAVVHNYWFLTLISLLIIIGGIGFPIMFNFWHWMRQFIANQFYIMAGRRQKYRHIPHLLSSNFVIVISITLFLLISGTILFLITEYRNTLEGQPFYGKLTTAFFMSTSPRTAGFNSFDMMQLRPITTVFMMLLMWIGASPMSTGGGIKTTTFGIALLNIWNTLRGRDYIEVRHRRLASSTINRAFIIIFISIMLISIGVMLIMTFDPHIELRRIIFEVISAFATVGLSLNLTPLLSTGSHIVLICLMFIGRVGLITLLACFIKEKQAKFYQYPSENISIN